MRIASGPRTTLSCSRIPLPRARRGRRVRVRVKSSAGSPPARRPSSPEDTPVENPGPSAQEAASPETAPLIPLSSEEWLNRPSTLALPAHARTAESWLILATFLKILQVGTSGGNLIVMIAGGSVMLVTIKQILDRKWHENRFFPLVALICSGIALWICHTFGI